MTDANTVLMNDLIDAFESRVEHFRGLISDLRDERRDLRASLESVRRQYERAVEAAATGRDAADALPTALDVIRELKKEQREIAEIVGYEFLLDEELSPPSNLPDVVRDLWTSHVDRADKLRERLDELPNTIDELRDVKNNEKEQAKIIERLQAENETYRKALEATYGAIAVIFKSDVEQVEQSAKSTPNGTCPECQNELIHIDGAGSVYDCRCPECGWIGERQ